MFDVDPVAQLAEVTDGLVGDSLDLPEVVLGDRVRALASAIDRLEAELVRTTAAWDARRAWSADGAIHPGAWLVANTSRSQRDARDLLRSARLCANNDATAKALAAGDVTTTHVAMLSRAAANGRARLYAEHETVLLDAARTLAPEPFRQVARRWTVLADEEMATREANWAYDHRRLHLSSTFGGAVVANALWDAESGAIVDAALKAFAKPDPVNGDVPPRTKAQRYADAMVEVCQRALASMERPPHQANIDIVVDAATMVGLQTADLTTARCDIVGIGPVAMETIRRIMCDALLRRVVVDAKGEVLDLGTAVPTANRAQRRALAHRDGGCGFPGCTRPHWECDAHHLTSRKGGGATDLENLILLCRRHHRLVHEGGWRLWRDDETGVVMAAPP